MRTSDSFQTAQHNNRRTWQTQTSKHINSNNNKKPKTHQQKDPKCKYQKASNTVLRISCSTRGNRFLDIQTEKFKNSLTLWKNKEVFM